MRVSNEFRIYIALVIGVAILPALGAYPVFVMQVMCFALFAAAFNLLVGFTGLLSFGHAAFLGVAAYSAGHALKVWALPTEAGLLFGALVGGLVGLVMGALAIRRSGIYFSMITLALAQMLYYAFLQMPFTGGEDGLQSVPRGTLLGTIDLADDLSLYYVVLAICVLGCLLIYRTVHSPFGQVLKAIRENEPRAISLGYKTARYKLMAFVISATLAGLAGATKTLVLGFATLSDAHWSTSGLVILMVLLGGMGTMLGPIVGAFIIVALENKVGDIGDFLFRHTGIEWFSGLGESVTIVIGLIFVVCVMAFRRGIVGELIAWRARTASSAVAH